MATGGENISTTDGPPLATTKCVITTAVATDGAAMGSAVFCRSLFLIESDSESYYVPHYKLTHHLVIEFILGNTFFAKLTNESSETSRR